MITKHMLWVLHLNLVIDRFKCYSESDIFGDLKVVCKLFSTYLAHSASLPTGLYILLA